MSRFRLVVRPCLPTKAGILKTSLDTGTTTLALCTRLRMVGVAMARCGETAGDQACARASNIIPGFDSNLSSTLALMLIVSRRCRRQRASGGQLVFVS
jgi:hypothetical protein